MSYINNWFRPRPDKPSIKPPPIIMPDNPTSPILPSEPHKITHDGNVHDIGMSYWRNINNHIGLDYLKVVLSVDERLRLFILDKITLNVIEEEDLGINHTGEGVFFSANNANKLFIPIEDQLYSLDIFSKTRTIEMPAPEGRKLWQCHANYNETVFSATLKDENYNIVEWYIFSSGIGHKIPLEGNPDECQIDKTGNWLFIKEDNYNRIRNLLTKEETIITNEKGALGHSDCGFNCALGENDMSQTAGALDLITFNTWEHKFMFGTGIWNMGYVSFTNAKPNTIEQKVLVTTPNDLVLVDFDWPHPPIFVCKNLTESQEYENRPKANQCPQGEYAVWTALVNGRRDAFIVRLP